jgi:hypothetical protein
MAPGSVGVLMMTTRCSGAQLFVHLMKVNAQHGNVCDSSIRARARARIKESWHGNEEYKDESPATAW